MPTFRNRDTGVIVNVDEKTAKTLDSAYEPINTGSKPAKGDGGHGSSKQSNSKR